MSLYGKSRRASALNFRKDGTKNSSLSGLKNAPLKMSGPYPERQITFKTAKPDGENFQKVISALEYISSDLPIPGTELLSINSGKIAPIFLGQPGQPDPQYLYGFPETYNPDKFFSQLQDD